MLVDLEAGNEDVFTAGRQTVQIEGKWGFREVTEDSGTDINKVGGYTATDVTLTVDDGSKFAVGQTILIGSEQHYITAISTNDLTVTRGVNGTTAAAIADNADVNIFRFPDPIAQACLMQSSRLWKRKDSGFASRVGLPQTGGFDVFQGLDPDVKQLLSSYRRPSVGVGMW